MDKSFWDECHACTWWKGYQEWEQRRWLEEQETSVLQINPVNKKIPVIIHKGKPICEPLVPVQYIDEVWNNRSPLLPSEFWPYQSLQARVWADYVDEKIYYAGRKVWTTKGEVQQAARKELIAALKLLEEHLGDRPYVGEDKFGFVDLALLPFYSWFKACS